MKSIVARFTFLFNNEKSTVVEKEFIFLGETFDDLCNQIILEFGIYKRKLSIQVYGENMITLTRKNFEQFRGENSAQIIGILFSKKRENIYSNS